jgi:hypothetical protein
LLVSIAAAAAFCITVPRIGPLVLVAFTLVVGLLLLARDVWSNGWQNALKATFIRPEMLFVAWAFIACLWSLAPDAAFLKSLFLAALILHAIVLSRHIPEIDRSDVEAMALGLVIGFVLGGLYILLEIPLRDAIGRLVLTYFPDLDRGLDKHGRIRDGVVTRISGAHITRVSAVFCLLLFPTMLAVSLYTKGVVKWLSFAIIAAASLMILLHPHSQSQTAQLALLVGLVFAVLAIASQSVARWIAGAAFAGALLFIVPASIGMFAADLHENQMLFKSARARVVIWHFTAERILERPILGVGTYSTRYLDEMRAKQLKAENTKLVVPPATRAHPHNIYLNVWYELGLIGALAFGVLGLSLLRKVSQLPKQSFVFAIGHFAVCMTIIGSTYGLWQNWFQSAIAVSILALILVAQGQRGVRPAS